MMRFIEYSVSREFHPTTIYEYYVTGSSTFPFDMLRHDSCWPCGPEDAAMMDRDYGRLRSIKMRSWCMPTIDRWSSFTWSVGTEDLNDGGGYGKHSG